MFIPFILLSSIYACDHEPISVTWNWKNGNLAKSDCHNFIDKKTSQKHVFLLNIPFSLSHKKKICIKDLSVSQLKIIKIGKIQITNIEGIESITFKQELNHHKFVTSLLKVDYRDQEGMIEGIAKLYCIPKKKEKAAKEYRGGNCFKCNGKGKVGSWCTFCNNFVSWCRHGHGWKSCNACSGIGWIETYYQRCPRCTGRGWVGTWCTFCHAHVVWCIHGRRWRSCNTCRGKGALTREYSACSKCHARGWVGTYCPFCKCTVKWCRHGKSPRTCSKCGGRGVVKN